MSLSRVGLGIARRASSEAARPAAFLSPRDSFPSPHALVHRAAYRPSSSSSLSPRYPPGLNLSASNLSILKEINEVEARHTAAIARACADSFSIRLMLSAAEKEHRDITNACKKEIGVITWRIMVVGGSAGLSALLLAKPEGSN